MVTSGLPDDKASTQDRRWPVGVALLSAWLLPATTAQRTRHASFNKIFLVHLIAVLATVVAIALLVAWHEAVDWFNADASLRHSGGVFNRLLRDFTKAPVEFLLAIVGIALLIELAHAVLAVVVMPWGARDEALRRSYRNALRQSLLKSAHVLALVVMFGTVLVASKRLKQEWMIRNNIIRVDEIPTIPILPPIPPGDPAYDRALVTYRSTVKEYDRQASLIQDLYTLSTLSKPWYIELREPVLIVLGGAMVLWFLWALLRSVGARRDVITIVRPPTCEACGYNLTAIPMESRCPECGDAVLKSLGPDARPGSPWQDRAMIGIVSAWCKTAFVAIQTPDELGHQLRTADPGIDHRRFMALHLPIVFGVGFLTLFVFALLLAPDDMFRDELPMFLMVMTMFGMACVGGMVVFSLLAAATIGSFESYRYKRNLLPAAMQIASYLATYLTIWAVFGGATSVGVNWAKEAYVFRGLEDLTGVYHETLFVATWLVPNVACCIWFFLLLYRGTIGAAYANR